MNRLLGNVVPGAANIVAAGHAGIGENTKGQEETTMTKESIYDRLEREIREADLTDAEKNTQLSRLLKARGQKINLLLVGATGSGKSSTINSLFNTSVAKVGVGVDPETADITFYQLENLTIWDSPGLGDNLEKDDKYAAEIVRKLSETDKDGVPIMDLVVVVVDASSKDLATTYDLINKVLLPCLTEKNKDRIIIAVNQADMAMKGNHWDREKNCPDEVLTKFLEEKCSSMQARLKEATGQEFKTLFYCAGYTDDDGTQRPAYNLTKLLYQMLVSLPPNKRMAIAENLNPDEENYKHDDKKEDYVTEISRSFGEVFCDTVADFAETGLMTGGTVLGVPGAVIGTVVGGAVGMVVGFFKGLFYYETEEIKND